MDLKKIAQQAVQGDANAFGALYKKFKSPVLCRVKMFTNGDTELAEDITQEAFIKAFNNIHKFNPETNFQTWVTRIAKNTLLDHLKLNEQKNKKLSLTSSVSGDDEDSSLLSIVKNNNAECAETICQTNEMMQALFSTVDKVIKKNSKQLRIFELRFLEEWKYEDIAQELNIPLGTVRTEVRNIRLKLQREFERVNFKQNYCV